MHAWTQCKTKVRYRMIKVVVGKALHDIRGARSGETPGERWIDLVCGVWGRECVCIELKRLCVS